MQTLYIVEVLKIGKDDNIVKLKTICINDKGHRVLTGEAFVMSPLK